MSNLWIASVPGVANTRSSHWVWSGRCSPPSTTRASGTPALMPSYAALSMAAYSSGVPSKAQSASGSFTTSQVLIVSLACSAISPASSPYSSGSAAGQRPASGHRSGQLET